jgi:hypothetical protein
MNEGWRLSILPTYYCYENWKEMIIDGEYTYNCPFEIYLNFSQIFLDFLFIRTKLLRKEQ